MLTLNDTFVDLGTIVEGTSPVIRARVLNEDDGLILKASLSNVKMKIYDITAPDAVTIVGSETTLTINDVWYDTLQTSETWTGETGFNFEYIVPAASLTGTAGSWKRYQIEIRGTPVTGAVFWVVRATIQVSDAQGI